MRLTYSDTAVPKLGRTAVAHHEDPPMSNCSPSSTRVWKQIRRVPAEEHYASGAYTVPKRCLAW